jgi:hypothetical protein
MPRSRSAVEILAAVILLFAVIGVIVLVYFWLRPLGAMTVIYVRRESRA